MGKLTIHSFQIYIVNVYYSYAAANYLHKKIIHYISSQKIYAARFFINYVLCDTDDDSI
jgi:hypothetical protein